jgi:hypothetical protein
MRSSSGMKFITISFVQRMGDVKHITSLREVSTPKHQTDRCGTQVWCCQNQSQENLEFIFQTLFRPGMRSGTSGQSQSYIDLAKSVGSQAAEGGAVTLLEHEIGQQPS